MPSTIVPAVQELHASRADMATVVEGFFNGTFSAKGIERDRLVVRHIPSCSSSYLQLTHLTIHFYYWGTQCLARLSSEQTRCQHEISSATL